MRQNRAIDVSTGLFVLLGVAAMLFLVTQISNREFTAKGKGYRVVAQFDNVGGLKVGAPVKMAGVTIGRVEELSYDMKLFKAVVTMDIDSRYDQIPNDSDASIYTAGLLGGQYIGIEPGGSEDYLKAGDQIEFVQNAIVLESLISKYLFGQGIKETPPGQAPESGAAAAGSPAPADKK